MGRLMVVGVNGRQGSGKTTLTRALEFLLDPKPVPEEGRAIALSIDDYYLPKADRDRAEFRARGYNPEGISNRGPAGTHDLERLKTEWDALEKSHEQSITRLTLFDKAADDRLKDQRVIHGRVGILLVEGWFLGAAAPADPARLPAGLKRSVGEALVDWQALFSRIDRILAFKPAPPETILRQREEQEMTLARRTGGAGMTPEQIRRFLHYMNIEAWDPPLTQPDPAPDRPVIWVER